LKTRRATVLLALIVVAIISMLAADGYAKRSWLPRRHAAIKWTYNIDEGLAKAKRHGKPVMVDFMAVWCPGCKAMDDSTFVSPAVIRRAGAFIPVRIDIDTQREVAAKYNALARKYGGIGIPNILFMTADGKKLKHIVGYYGPQQIIAAMDSALAAPK